MIIENKTDSAIESFDQTFEKILQKIICDGHYKNNSGFDVYRF